MSIIIDTQPSSQQWVNQASPPVILENQGSSGSNALQASGTGTSIFTQQLNTLYGDKPTLSQLSDIQFSTYRDSNADNKDWYVNLQLDGLDQNSNAQVIQAKVYPRNATNFQYYSSIWMGVDKDVIQVDVNGNLSSFASFKAGAYTLFKVTSISIGTEDLAGFDGQISDVSVSFTSLRTLEFNPQVNVNNVVLGAPGALLSLQNNKFALSSGGVELLAIDGDNGKISLNSEINLLGPMGSTIDMGGKNFTNVGAPTNSQSITNKAYVDGFFDQLAVQMQWFNSYLTSDSQITFTQNNQTQNISLLDTVTPEPIDDTIFKLSSNSFRLNQSNFRVEMTLNIKYETLQSQPVSVQLIEVDVNGSEVAGSLLTQSQTTLKPFGLNQFVTTTINTTLVIAETSYFAVKLLSPVPQIITVQQGSRFYINRLFDQTQNGIYQPINTLITPINKLKLPDGNLSLNTNKIVNLAEPTLSSDAVTKNYVDSTFLTSDNADANYYNILTPLNQITSPNDNLSLNQHKITNLADATSATDALNRQTGDSRYYLNTTNLNLITAPNASLNLNSNKIINLANATTNTDALNTQYADSRYYLNTVNLSDINAPSDSLNLNSQKIINLANATLATDALNRQTADNRYYLNTVRLNNITTPDASLSLNSQKIINLADATLSTDALNRQTADSRYYLNTVTLNTITSPNGSLSLNNQKITNLANATLATDALNRQTADSRYYLNNVTLNSITAPNGSLSLNNQKIINVASPSNNSDASTKSYVDSAIANISLTIAALQTYIRVGSITVGVYSSPYTQISAGNISGCITSAFEQTPLYTANDLILLVNYSLPFTPIVNINTISLNAGSPETAQLQRYSIIQRNVTSTSLIMIMGGFTEPGPASQWQFKFVFTNPSLN